MDKILRDDLGKFPYHIKNKHKLTKNDKERRESMANGFMEKIELKFELRDSFTAAYLAVT